jgi:hypothetical protein
MALNYVAYQVVFITIVPITELSKYYLKASDALLTDGTGPLISENGIILGQ